MVSLSTGAKVVKHLDVWIGHLSPKDLDSLVTRPAPTVSWTL